MLVPGEGLHLWRWKWKHRITGNLLCGLEMGPSLGFASFPIPKKQGGHGEHFMAPSWLQISPGEAVLRHLELC